MEQDVSGLKYKEGTILVFDKPYGWTSFQLVNKVRWLLCRTYNWKKLKVGHAGTLDPLATGILVLCTGAATRNIDDIQKQNKTYIAEIALNGTTPSYDLETEIEFKYDTGHLTELNLQQAANEFIGEIDQIPPIFSAKKINGKRAYVFAREGVEQVLKSSKITIYNFELLSFKNPVATFKITCSKGTYIRSLAYDLGKKLKVGGYLKNLRRTEIGIYNEAQAMNIELFQKNLLDLKPN